MWEDDVSKYVQKAPSGVWRYYRRVPLEVVGFVKSSHVKTSLKTRNHREALEKAEHIHRSTLAMWEGLLTGNDNPTVMEQYIAAVKRAQSLGFTYKRPAEAVLEGEAGMGRRVDVAHEHGHTSVSTVSAVLGFIPLPSPLLSELWGLYEEHARSSLTGMSPVQLGQHKLSRERAIRYVISVLGDVKLDAIVRRDVLRYRDWWNDKIQREGLKAYSANRSLGDIKGMLSVIDNALQTNFKDAWAGLRLKETNATKLDKRLPFSVEWVQDRLLDPAALATLNEDARLIIYTMAETGMRLGEVCNLRQQDIRLDADVPHIEVAERADRRQKTDYSIRQIPLTGAALWAMRQRPEGFPRYADNANSASAAISKYLKAHGLLPSDRHTIYSLRHTFQDRIENAGASDRMQADLMGHEFGRPKYGDGAEMKRRLELLESIAFRWIPNI